MTAPSDSTSTRREFLNDSGRIAAVGALAAGSLPGVHTGGRDVIQVALVGCGGRGTGAATNALSVKDADIKLIATADVFEGKPQRTAERLAGRFGDKVDVPKDRQFVGFDSYRKAMDSLRPGDVIILATPPAFRWVHYRYAIEKRLNVFMEKPVTVDGPTCKKMLELNELAKAQNLKVGVGLMSRHNHGMQELAKRIADGEIGDITYMRGYRMHGPAAFFRSVQKPEGITDLMYQIQRFHSFLWASGGNFSDFNIHIVDHLCWMKNKWPVEAQGVGGRHYREGPDGRYVDQNFDSYSVEYTFDDGTKMFFDGRCMVGAEEQYQSFAHGTKGMAIVSKQGDCGLPSGTFKGHQVGRENLIWRSQVPRDKRNPYQNEWDVLIDRIKNDEPHNEVESGVNTSMVTSMGRMAVHTGKVITYDMMMNHDHEFAPQVDGMTFDTPAPLQPDESGFYPVPMPGMKQLREY